MGGSAVKLLLYYRPDLEELSKRQLETVRFVATDCNRARYSLFGWTYLLSAAGRNKDTIEFAIKSQEWYRICTKNYFHSDWCLKAEFPADMRFEKDSGRVLGNVQNINWSLCSSLGIAQCWCRLQSLQGAGQNSLPGRASGFLGGRGIWQECFVLMILKRG